MRIFGVFASPLAGTAAVMAGLAVMAVPLYRLTSAAPVVARLAVETPQGCSSVLPSVLRLKLLTPAKKVIVRLPGGASLLDLADVPAGESEHDTGVLLEHGSCELELVADFDSATSETAVFLTVMPDGLDEETLFTTGSGHLEDVLHFEWPHEHP
jgi:hypothetical protein